MSGVFEKDIDQIDISELEENPEDDGFAFPVEEV